MIIFFTFESIDIDIDLTTRGSIVPYSVATMR